MLKPRTLAAALILLALAVAIPAQAAPAAKIKLGQPSLAAALVDALNDLRGTLTAWIGAEGSGVDPFGNHGTTPPPPEGSGVDPFGNHGTPPPPPEGSGVDPWGGV